VANESLKSALEKAGLTVEQFAEIVQVDPKSVQRWVSGPTVPYPKHRARIASALDLAEHDLWPEHTPDSTTSTQPRAAPAAPGRAGDVIGAWGAADDTGAPDLVAFVSDATGPIDVLDSSCQIEITTPLTDALLEHAAAGNTVRILTDGRSPHWEPLLTNEPIELYLCEIPGEYWLLKTSDRMLLAINLDAQPANSPPPPILELALSEDQLFARLTAKFEELWEAASDTDGGMGQEVGSERLAQTVKDEPVPEPGAGSDVGGRRWPGQRS
jgi:lambda repressor-like predicted transcriptional regulator